MASLTIKNIPRELHKRLKKSAEAHRRSINGEVIVLLEEHLMSGPVDPEEFLRRARALRESTPSLVATEKDLRHAKDWGRL